MRVDATNADDVVSVERGEIDRRIYSDEEIFDRREVVLHQSRGHCGLGGDAAVGNRRVSLFDHEARRALHDHCACLRCRRPD